MNNLIELNIILYYADFLSLRDTSTTVTDNCKYVYIHDAPINCAYVNNTIPFYDKHNKYLIQAANELNQIKTKFGVDGMKSFIDGLGYIKIVGSIDAKQLLNCIHYYSTRYDRQNAFTLYYRWIKSQSYSHITINEKGDPERTICTRYIAHAEQGTPSEPQVNYTYLSTK